MRMKRKVWVNKGNKQKLITIPKDSDIEGGDWVWIEKINSTVIKKEANEK
jgi:hypothetical protein